MKMREYNTDTDLFMNYTATRMGFKFKKLCWKRRATFSLICLFYWIFLHESIYWINSRHWTPSHCLPFGHFCLATSGASKIVPVSTNEYLNGSRGDDWPDGINVNTSNKILQKAIGIQLMIFMYTTIFLKLFLWNQKIKFFLYNLTKNNQNYHYFW